MKKLLPWFFVLIATTSYGKDVTLSWDASPTENVQYYVLYYETGTTFLVEGQKPPTTGVVKVVAGNVLLFEIANLPDNEEQRFGVTAVIEPDESVLSNIVTSQAITPEPLPQLDLNIHWNIIQDNNE